MDAEPASTPAVEMVELVVVGAGWAGLSMAKTYHQVHPDAKLVILDSASSIGGTWAKERLYPSLRTNNLVGTFEFSDFPMILDTTPDVGKFNERSFHAAEGFVCGDRVKKGEHIPGDVVHDYLEASATRFGVRECVRLGWRVKKVERKDDGSWNVGAVRVEVDGYINDHQEHSTTSILHLHTQKLVIATGLTSAPYMPSFRHVPLSQSVSPPGKEAHSDAQPYTGTFTHFSTLGHPSTLSALKSAKHVTILGGTKSAFDAVHLVASLSPSVPYIDWIIRASGHGPCWMSPAHVTPLKIQLEKLVHTRFLTWFSPCYWGFADGFSATRYLLQQTWIGKVLCRSFWRAIEGDLRALNGYGDEAMAKLRPQFTPYDVGASLSIRNYPQGEDVYDLVRSGRVHVRVADVDFLTAKEVHLKGADGEKDMVEADVVICCTGWLHRPTIEFVDSNGGSAVSFETSVDERLGIPRGDHRSTSIPSLPNTVQAASASNSDSDVGKDWVWENDSDSEPGIKDLINTAVGVDTQIDINSLTSPHLSESASPLELPIHSTNPYLLHRFVAPTGLPYLTDRSIAFIGMLTSISTPMILQVQALWIIAWFDHKLDLSKSVDMKTQHDEPIASLSHSLTSQAHKTHEFLMTRYQASFNARFPDFIFDALPYLDLVLTDLGLDRWRRVRKTESQKYGWWDLGLGSVRAWFNEVFRPYGPGDYVGLIDEWVERRSVQSNVEK